MLTNVTMLPPTRLYSSAAARRDDVKMPHLRDFLRGKFTDETDMTPRGDMMAIGSSPTSTAAAAADEIER